MEICREKLLQPNVNELERFTLYGIQTYARIMSIYDGDTFDITFVVPMSCFTNERSLSKTKKGICMICDYADSTIIMRMKCRLDGIDARELKSEGGKEAKQILEELIANQILRCEFRGQDKYGRQLIRLFIHKDDLEIDVSKHLQQYPEYFCFYDGGKKLF